MQLRLKLLILLKMKANCLMLDLDNVYWMELNDLVSKIFEGWTLNSELPIESLNYNIDVIPHVTLIYSTEAINHVTLMYALRSTPNEAYKHLIDNGSINLTKLVVDAFESDTQKVLKINLSESNEVKLLTEINSHLKASLELKSTYTEFNPHITITYLKPDTPEDLIEKFKAEINDSNYLKFDLTEVCISNDSESVKLHL